MIVPVAAVLVGTGVFGAALGLGMLVLFAAATSSGCGFLEARSAVRRNDPRTGLAVRTGSREDDRVPPTPDFVMPEPVHREDIRSPEHRSQPPLRHGLTSETPPTSETPEAAESAAPGSFAPPRAPWQQLVAAALVGVLVGAGLPAAIQGIDRAAADARVESLRQTATAYLQAIADGDAALATAMVPSLRAEDVAPDALLQSARRIEEPEVRLVMVDGDSATVEVRFEVGSRRVTRTLEAERIDGAWQLSTSLTERVTVHSYDASAAASSAGVSVGGVVLRPNGAVLLYPGQYEVDVLETALFRSGGDSFEVDADPGTTSDVFASTTVSDAFGDTVVAVAAAHVEACQQLPDCPIDAEVDPEQLELLGDVPYIMGVELARGTIDLIVPLGQVGAAGGWQDLQVRALLDEAGSLVSWECAEVGRPHLELEPCRP